MEQIAGLLKELQNLQISIGKTWVCIFAKGYTFQLYHGLLHIVVYFGALLLLPVLKKHLSNKNQNLRMELHQQLIKQLHGY